MSKTLPIIATVRGTPEQRERLKECAKKLGVSLNTFILASALTNVNAMQDVETGNKSS